MSRKILLLSSSRVGDTEYLSHALNLIKGHLGAIKKVLFIPYAAVTISYDEYTETVRRAFKSANIDVHGIHEFEDPLNAIRNSQAITVGGGNTFRLLERLYHFNLLDGIRSKTASGAPYIGWSAGSNIAGISIKTTNDMPIVEPNSFNALNLVPFQLNPHYSEYRVPGHNGESREQRIAEFMKIEQQVPVVGLVEGTGLLIRGTAIDLVQGQGVSANGYLFKSGTKTQFCNKDDIRKLLNS